ncbi:hypothetical protein MARINOS108_120001 [Marinoscillum sp. 108]|nr:hypothetical protein MARINOS108_120001 [Marinoscillum sp. 108]
MSLSTVIPAQAGISFSQNFSGPISGIALLFDGAQSDNAQRHFVVKMSC